jgi:hypothetical protein
MLFQRHAETTRQGWCRVCFFVLNYTIFLHLGICLSLRFFIFVKVASCVVRRQDLRFMLLLLCIAYMTRVSFFCYKIIIYMFHLAETITIYRLHGLNWLDFYACGPYCHVSSSIYSAERTSLMLKTIGRVVLQLKALRVQKRSSVRTMNQGCMNEPKYILAR